MYSGVVFPSNGVVINKEMIFSGNNYGICNGDTRVLVVFQVIILIQPDIPQTEEDNLVPFKPVIELPVPYGFPGGSPVFSGDVSRVKIFKESTSCGSPNSKVNYFGHLKKMWFMSSSWELQFL